MRSYDEITGAVLDAAIKIHSAFGPGMLESVYEKMLVSELTKRGFAVESQKDISFEYGGTYFKDAFRIDLLVDGKVVVELKSTEKNIPVYHKQVKTYLKVMNLPIGLLVNFGLATLKEGFARIVNNLDPSQSNLRVNMQETAINSLRHSASPREAAFEGGC